MSSEEEATHANMRDALRALLDVYVNLANSGDAGFWDPEKTPEVIAARAALAAPAQSTISPGQDSAIQDELDHPPASIMEEGK